MRETLRWKIAQSFELRWWQRYLGSREKAPYLRWKHKYWEDLVYPLRNDIPFEEVRSVLDAGCGPAGIYMIFEDREVVAFDPLLDKYDNDVPHFERNDYPWVDFHTSPLELWDDERQFDLVCCMNAINHVSDINLAYDRLCDSVKPGGYLLITIDAHNHAFFKSIFRAIPGDVLHPHQYDLQEYRDMVTSRGFEPLAEQRIKHEFFFDHYLQAFRKKAVR